MFRIILLTFFLTNLGFAKETTSTVDNLSPNIIVGTYAKYSLRGIQSEPLFLFSTDVSETWTALKQVPHFPNFTDVDFKSLTCLDGHCITIGEYIGFNWNNKDKPLLWTSKDNGQTWEEAKISHLPRERMNVNGVSLSCNNKNCVAVGYHQPYNNYIFSNVLLLSSNNKGESWEYINSISGLPLPMGKLTDINCTDQYCIAIGNDSIGQKPLIIISKDGQAWSRAEVSTAITTQLINPTLTKIKCHKNICVVVGYQSPQDNNKKAFFLISHDNGLSWSFNQRLTQLLSDGFNDLFFTNDYCFFITESHNNAVIIVSRDDGFTWQSFLVTNIDLNNFITKINDISCTNDYCVAIGQIKDKNKKKSMPLILYSNDRDKLSWSMIQNISLFPNYDNGDATLLSLKCKDKNCVATGEFLDNRYKRTPLLLISNSSGRTWSLSTKLSELPLNRSNVRLSKMFIS